LSSVTQLNAYRGKTLVLTGLILLISITGCAKRQLIRITPQMNAEQKFWIRVLLLEKTKTCSLESASSFIVVDAETQTTQAEFKKTTQPKNIKISEGKITIGGIPFTSGQLIVFPDVPHIFRLNGDAYRGKLKLILNRSANSFTAVNLIPLEPYLAGVIGAEMPDYWEMDALKAQTIAARTYCLYIKRNHGIKRNWDVSKTQANQVYKGLKVESSRIWNAVTATTGQVLTAKQENGLWDIFPAYYSSTCGGHTESSKNVFGDSFETLKGVKCGHCKDVAKPKIFYWPMAQFETDYVTERVFKKFSKLKPLKKIISITPHKKSNYGDFSRITSVKLKGSNGKDAFLRAEDLRLTIDPTGRKIKSTICQIVSTNGKFKFLYGRGWGHGVGLCQCGAQALARKGYLETQILSYYYPGSRVVNVY